MRTFLITTALAVSAAAAAAQTPGVAPATPQAPHPMMQFPDTRDGVVAMVRDHFARMDTNRDGFIVGDEMQAMRAQRMGKRMAMRGANSGGHRDPAAAFDRLDTNRDNMVSREEFAAGRAARAEHRAERGAMRGQRMAMRGHGEMLRRADADNDGRVSLAEAQNAALQRFDRTDLNRDGRITPEERQQLRQQRMQRKAAKAG